MRLIRRFKFDAGHALDDYCGKCKHTHGHTYHCELEFEGRVIGLLEPSDGSHNQGMVVDFHALDKAIAETNEYLDHHYLNYVFGFRPTAENLAVWIARFLNNRLIDPHIALSRVRLWETEDSAAEVRAGDWEMHAPVQIRMIVECNVPEVEEAAE